MERRLNHVLTFNSEGKLVAHCLTLLVDSTAGVVSGGESRHFLQDEALI